jgi:zinc transport system ATP-binding protein
MTTPVIALHDVAVGYGDRPVVEHADLVVRPGDVVALVGANGSGKTTLVRGILGLAPVLAGRVELLGRPAASFRERWRIGYVPQRHTVGGGIPSSVQEVVASGRLARRRLLSPATTADRQAVREALEIVGLADRRSAPVATLSGGQQRRTLIARALAADPDVLIMDEPTAGVDIGTKSEILDMIRGLADAGKGVIVISSEYPELLALADRILVLRDGTVVDDLDRGDVEDEESLQLAVQGVQS